MKPDFFLSRSHSSYHLFFLLTSICWMFYIILAKDFNLFTIILLIYLVCLCLYHKVDDKVSGLYITSESLTYRRLFFKKVIDINSIGCIRIKHEVEKIFGWHQICRNENGNILFRMRFYHNYYEKDQMDGYDTIEEIKRFFIERQICHCVYDKEALDYLLTLNPNIKVIYEKE